MKQTSALLCCLLLLSACGYTRLERAGSGAVVGGITGGVVGALCCADPPHGILVGSYVGAAGGAAIGALLPEPVFQDWREDAPEAPVPPPTPQPKPPQPGPDPDIARRASTSAAPASVQPVAPAAASQPGRYFPVENPPAAYIAPAPAYRPPTSY